MATVAEKTGWTVSGPSSTRPGHSSVLIRRSPTPRRRLVSPASLVHVGRWKTKRSRDKAEAPAVVVVIVVPDVKAMRSRQPKPVKSDEQPAYEPVGFDPLSPHRRLLAEMEKEETPRGAAIHGSASRTLLSRSGGLRSLHSPLDR